MTEMFKVVTTDGVLADKGREGDGLSADQADASAHDRNERAEEMGLKVRYEVRPL